MRTSPLQERLDFAMKLDHIGIAVESLRAALPVFEKLLGRRADFEEEVNDQQVRVAVFKLGRSRIELLEATSSDSPIARFLARRGPGMHHLTLSVPKLAEKVAELGRSGLRLIDPKPRRGAGKSRIAFLHPASTSGVLIELVEAKRHEARAGRNRKRRGSKG
jgi:methylmalonyl-CoA/ethylmalonyl-CoA epimerase